MNHIPTHFIVADDDAINNMMCRFCIKRRYAGALISTFEKPIAALDMIAKEYTTAEHKRTMLFLDISMPKIDAWQFLERFEALEETVHDQIAIYILSSSEDPRNRERALA